MAYKDHPPRIYTRNEKRETSKEVESNILNFLSGSQNSESAAEDKYGVDAGDVIDIMLENNFERCTGCDLWLPNNDLYEDKSGISYRCRDCLKDE